MKGFTGHEQLDRANLVHMGGRLYDPRLGRFLSADPLVQAPHVVQNYDRYSYVLNNPMNYVDPTGYSWLSKNWKTIASIGINFFMPGALNAVFGLVTDGLTAAVLTGATSGAVNSGSLKGALMGAFSAGISHGIGGYFDAKEGFSAGDWAFSDQAQGALSMAGKLAKGAAHAVNGGLMSAMNGGKFGRGPVAQRREACLARSERAHREVRTGQAKQG